MCADSARRKGVADTFQRMHTTNDTPDLDGYVGWVVDDLKWGTLQDYLGTEEEARELSSRTGGGPIYKRTWMRLA
ncbi:hypothetical protein COJE103337_10055 [Corynebacterium jeikeium]|nr:hypothetical protein BWP03_09250 [Corynebacterium jeikeium]WCZ53865.1 hypothetical protein CJEIK_06795 [Corynebacterium jeikeium]SUY80821.1 Uncharacterised protein [Corynebacterium jeikeium]